MAFGFDDALFAILTGIAGAGAGAAFAPDAPQNVLGGAIGAGAGPGVGAAFELPTAPTRTPGETVNQSGQGVDLGPQEAVTESIAKILAAQGPPPTVPLEPLPPPPPPPAVGEAGSTQAGPPVSRAGTAPPASPAPSIGEVLLSSPAALNAVANLLGLGPQEPHRQVGASIPGGTVGNVVPGLQLPQTTNIGQLLAQIPGLR